MRWIVIFLSALLSLTAHGIDQAKRAAALDSLDSSLAIRHEIEAGRQRYIACDLYSQKYIEFYDTRRQEMCDNILQQNDSV